MKKPKTLVELFTELLEPCAIPTSDRQEVLQQAAIRAGWRRPSAKAQLRQQVAAQHRKIQREEDLALRRVFIAIFFKTLRPGLQAKPGSLGTAQAILGKLEAMKLERHPPMTVRTIQADIKFLRENGNFGM
jgi:hypothetical protein